MLNLRRLRLLRELEARGTLAAVARALSYSPSGVSQQLAQLEREAGARLLEPLGRGVRLTDAGVVLARHAEVLLGQVERAEAELAASTGAALGTVRVACFQTSAVTLVPHALTRLAADHPGVRVEVLHAEPESALERLAFGHVDLVVGTEYDHVPQPRNEAIHRESLFSERVLVALPNDHPALDRSAEVSLAELADVAWAAGHSADHAHVVERTCNTLGGFQPDIRHRSDDLLVLRSLVAAGHAVTLLPEFLVGGEPEGIALRPPVEGELSRHVFTAARSQGRARPAIVAVRAAIADAARAVRGIE